MRPIYPLLFFFICSLIACQQSDNSKEKVVQLSTQTTKKTADKTVTTSEVKTVVDLTSITSNQKRQKSSITTTQTPETEKDEKLSRHKNAKEKLKEKTASTTNLMKAPKRLKGRSKMEGFTINSNQLNNRTSKINIISAKQLLKNSKNTSRKSFSKIDRFNKNAKSLSNLKSKEGAIMLSPKKINNKTEK